MKSVINKTSAGILFLLLAVSCAQKPQKQIFGKWQDQEGMITEFFEDGRMTLRHPTDQILGSDTITGQWKVLDNTRIQFTFSYAGVTKTLTNTFRFSGKDSLEMTDQDRNRSWMTRM
jgi:hypothetical protein